MISRNQGDYTTPGSKGASGGLCLRVLFISGSWRIPVQQWRHGDAGQAKL